MEIRPIFSNPNEEKVHTILRRKLASTRFEVHPLKVNRVLRERQFLSLQERRMMVAGEFDFVIVTSADSRPVFAIEFDGLSHSAPKQATRDTIKNRLCHRVDFPLLRIRKPSIIEHDGTTLLEYMVELFLAWEREKHELLEAYQNGLDRSTDPPNDFPPDPHTVFGISHPFPATEAVQKRLWEQYRIDRGFDYFQDGKLIVNSERNSNASFVCCVSQGSSSAGDLYEVEHNVRIYPAGRNQPVHRLTTKFSVRGWIPLEQALPTLSELPSVMDCQTVEEVNRVGELWLKRANGMSFPRVPGVNPDAIAWNFGEYLALRQTEEWAKSLYRFTIVIN